MPLTPGDIVISDVTFAYPADEDAPAPAPPSCGRRQPSAFPPDALPSWVPPDRADRRSSLLTRTWDLPRGTVTIGGTNVADASLTDLPPTVAYAPQRPYLFNDTLRGLLLAAPSATDEDLESALKAVDLTGWLATEKDGPGHGRR